jgi:hypothetical protein
VSTGIIQTALANKTLRLELDYRLPSMLRQGDDAIIEGPTIDTALAFQYDDPQVSDEFACLLMVI